MAWNLPLREDQWRKLRTILRDYSGMDLPDNRQTDMLEACAKASEFAGGLGFDALVAKLQSPDQDALRSVWISAFTIHETYFFRDAPQWDAIRRIVLPERIAARRDLKTLRIWSAGCSSGEEAYTAAILIDSVLPETAGWTIRIIGTDISSDILQKARKGVYREWAFRQTPMHLRDDYFENCGHSLWKIQERVSRHVRFDILNLKTGNYPSLTTGLFDLDLVLCRNVLIYFARDEMNHIISRLTQCLAPGGFLALGPAEPYPPAELPLDLVASSGSALYRQNPKPVPAMQPLELPSPPVNRSPKPVETQMPALSRELIPPAGAGQALNPYTWSVASSGLVEPSINSKTKPPENAPSSPDILFQIQQLADSGKWDAALESATRLVAAEPLNAEALYLNGLALKELGRLVESREVLRKCLFLNNKHWMAHLVCAGLWQREGNLERAKSHLQAILKGLISLDPAELLPATEGISVGRMRALADSQLRHLEGRN